MVEAGGGRQRPAILEHRRPAEVAERGGHGGCDLLRLAFCQSVDGEENLAVDGPLVEVVPGFGISASGSSYAFMPGQALLSSSLRTERHSSGTAYRCWVASRGSRTCQA